ncbi:MAG: pentapeptide repeat-containing protein [Planctomycetota bacterium]|jgi:uncharacterized protein YjbI with pentapeptide repeats
MSDTKSDGVGEQRKRRFSQEQYDMLKRCSDKKDMTEWNEWRKEHPHVDIELEGFYKANFYNRYLEGVYLHAYPNKLGKVYLREANFRVANLRGASFGFAYLEGAKFGCAEIQKGDFTEAHLEDTHFTSSNLKGANFMESHLENTVFRGVILDGETKFWNCTISKCVSSDVRGTDFTGSQLNVVRLSPGTKQLLEYNIRRMNWEDWYKGYRFGRWPVRWFWALNPPGIVSNLFELEGTRKGVFRYELIDMTRIERQPGEPVTVGKATAFVRAVYFSVVTQTTLGFGDMYANAQKVWGHVFLSLQVILGYVLLGALVTRFAVLFTAGGPAGKFSKKDKGEDAAAR